MNKNGYFDQNLAALLDAAQAIKVAAPHQAAVQPTVIFAYGGMGQLGTLSFRIALNRAGYYKPALVKIRVEDADTRLFRYFDPRDTFELAAPVADVLKAIKRGKYKPLQIRIGNPDRTLAWLTTEGNMGDGNECIRLVATTNWEYNQLHHGPKFTEWQVAPLLELSYAGRSRLHGSNNELANGTERRVLVWFIGGLGGGTFSGIHLPAAYRLRADLEERGLYQYRLNMIAFAPSLAEGFANKATKLANGAAAIREWDAHVKHQLPPLDLGRKRVERDRFAFHQVFLLDNKDEFGSYKTEDVIDRAGLALRLMTTGPISDQFVSTSQNNLGALRQYPNYLSTFNAYEIVLRPEELIALFRLKIGSDVIQEHLLRQLPEEETSALGREQARSYMAETKLSLDELSRLITVEPITLKQLQRYRGTALQNVIQRELSSRKKQLNKKVDNETERCQEVLERYLVSNANAAGIRQVPYFLDEVETRITQFRKALNLKVEQGRKQLLAHQRKTAPKQFILWRLLAALFYALFRGWAERRRRKQQVVEVGINLLLLKLAKQLTFIGNLEAAVERCRAQINGTVAGLNTVSERLQEQEADYDFARHAHRPSGEEPLLMADQEQEIYSSGYPSAWNQLTQGVSFGWNSEKHNLVLQLKFRHRDTEELEADTVTEAELCQIFAQYCEEPWLYLNETLSVERILAEQERNMDELLSHLIKRSSPLLKLNLPKQEDEEAEVIEEIWISSEHGPKGVWQGVSLPNSCTLVESGDPHRLSILAVKSHISPRSIVGYDTWQRAEAKKQAEGFPLYVWPVSDLDDESEKEVYW